jgi:hypothetical protein
MRGATLIELLIAMLLAAIAVAGALTGLAQAQRAWRDAERLARLHERAQYVFGTLEPELQMAGYFGSGASRQLNLDPATATGGLTSCGTGIVTPLQPALRIMRGWSLPCPPNGDGVMPGSAVLLLRRASTRVSDVPDGALQLIENAAPLQLRDVFVRIYYIARSADGDPRTPALRVKSLTAVAGEPAFIDTEVMPGVDELQVDLLPDAAAPRLAHIRLRVRADAADTRLGETPPTLTLDRRFTLRNAAL